MNNLQDRRCVLYARLSVTREESVSIARQLASCRSYARARGWQVIGEFVDDGVSATANRPEERRGWGSLLRCEGFDAVVIWKVDRLARRVIDFLRADEALQARGAGLVAVDDPIDMTSPQGRAFAVMLAVFGEMETEAMRARVRAARSQLLKVGRFAGGGIPYGYTSVPSPNGPGQVLVKDPVLIGWLADAVAMGLRGKPVNAIARWLTEQGAPLPKRQRTSGATGWNRQTVLGLLRNPVLAGMRPYNPGRRRAGGPVDPFAVVRDEQGQPVIDTSLAIISYDDFTRLQQLLDVRDALQARKKTERMATSPFLSRVAVCNDCGVYLCRGSNLGKPVLSCPRCRQTISRSGLDPYLIRRLLTERGGEPLAAATVRDRWNAAGPDEAARREILLTQLHSLQIRRGVVGRYFDEERVLLVWQPDAETVSGPREDRARKDTDE